MAIVLDEIILAMVRTKADAGSAKVCAAKAPRKVLSSGARSSSSSSNSTSSPSRSGSSKDRYSGGNSYNPQPTPTWQKGISTFFKTQEAPKESANSSQVLDSPPAGTSAQVQQPSTINDTNSDTSEGETS